MYIHAHGFLSCMLFITQYAYPSPQVHCACYPTYCYCSFTKVIYYTLIAVSDIIVNMVLCFETSQHNTLSKYEFDTMEFPTFTIVCRLLLIGIISNRYLGVLSGLIS